MSNREINRIIEELDLCKKINRGLCYLIGVCEQHTECEKTKYILSRGFDEALKGGEKDAINKILK